jgi:hypothetical protein
MLKLLELIVTLGIEAILVLLMAGVRKAPGWGERKVGLMIGLVGAIILTPAIFLWHSTAEFFLGGILAVVGCLIAI